MLLFRFSQCCDMLYFSQSNRPGFHLLLYEQTHTHTHTFFGADEAKMLFRVPQSFASAAPKVCVPPKRIMKLVGHAVLFPKHNDYPWAHLVAVSAWMFHYSTEKTKDGWWSAMYCQPLNCRDTKTDEHSQRGYGICLSRAMVACQGQTGCWSAVCASVANGVRVCVCISRKNWGQKKNIGW